MLKKWIGDDIIKCELLTKNDTIEGHSICCPHPVSTCNRPCSSSENFQIGAPKMNIRTPAKHIANLGGKLYNTLHYHNTHNYTLTNRHTATKSNISDWQPYDHKAQEIRLTATWPQNSMRQNGSHMATKCDTSGWDARPQSLMHRTDSRIL